jgi:hypothetical protein
MCFIFTYENKRIKPAEIVLKAGGGWKRRTMEGANLTKV